MKKIHPELRNVFKFSPDVFTSSPMAPKIQNNSRNKLAAQDSELEISVVAPSDQLININALMEDDEDLPPGQQTLQSA